MQRALASWSGSALGWVDQGEDRPLDDGLMPPLLHYNAADSAKPTLSHAIRMMGKMMGLGGSRSGHEDDLHGAFATHRGTMMGRRGNIESSSAQPWT